jgi:hypothetical protein
MSRDRDILGWRVVPIPRLRLAVRMALGLSFTSSISGAFVICRLSPFAKWPEDPSNEHAHHAILRKKCVFIAESTIFDNVRHGFILVIMTRFRAVDYNTGYGSRDKKRCL